MRMNRTTHLPFATALLLALALLATSCGGSDAGDAADPGAAATGVRQVSAADGAALQADPPADLVILDVRTPEEFDEAHLEGATLIDFYDDDFRDQITDLDRDAPYLLYCRSGNRSGQTATIMEELGFTNVADVDGGINAWTSGGHPTVTG